MSEFYWHMDTILVGCNVRKDALLATTNDSWVPAGVEPRFTGSKSVAVTTDPRMVDLIIFKILPNPTLSSVGMFSFIGVPKIVEPVRPLRLGSVVNPLETFLSDGGGLRDDAVCLSV